MVLYAVPINNKKHSLEDSAGYKELKEKTYNRVLKGKDSGGIKFNDGDENLARREAFQGIDIAELIRSFVVEQFRSS